MSIIESSPNIIEFYFRALEEIFTDAQPKIMKKILTTYANKRICITVNEEMPNHISVHEFGEPASGILKRWGTREELIMELEEIIKAIKSS